MFPTTCRRTTRSNGCRHAFAVFDAGGYDYITHQSPCRSAYNPFFKNLACTISLKLFDFVAPAGSNGPVARARGGVSGLHVESELGGAAAGLRGIVGFGSLELLCLLPLCQPLLE